MKRRTKNGLRKQVAAMLVLGLCVGLACPAAAWENSDRVSVDCTGTDGTYAGGCTMVTNTNTDIGSDEALAAALPTGETESAPLAMADAASGESENLPVCRTMLLDQRAVEIPQQYAANGAPRTSYQVGDKKNIWVQNDADTDVQVPMQCVATGTCCTVWYQVDHLEVDQAKCDAQEIAAQFDSIYATECEAFGSPMSVDVDGDGKVAVMVDLTSAFYLGYFWDRDLVDPTKYDPSDVDYDLYYQYGNGMDMVNMNDIPLAPERINNFYNTLAHEFQHLINYAVTNGHSDAWLNETFSQSAPEVCGLENLARDTYTNYLETFISSYGYSVPFVFSGNYTYVGNNFSGINPAESSLVYAQWYLFGRYLAAQTWGKEGGGNEIYKTILQSQKCTKDSLIQTLYQMGVLDSNDENGLSAFLRDYNLALYLQQADGAYSFHGLNVTDFVWPKDRPAAQLPAALRGGGAATFSVHPDQSTFTPLNADSNMRFAGLYEVADSRQGVTADVPSGTADAAVGNLVLGSPVTLTTADSASTIHYTVSTDGTAPAMPTAASDTYTGPLSFSQNTILAAASFGVDGTASAQTLLYYYVMPAPVTANLAAGTVADGSAVELSCATEGAVILYTTDGTEPAAALPAGQQTGETIVNGTLYTGPVPLKTSQTIRARAYLPGKLAVTCQGAVTDWSYQVAVSTSAPAAVQSTASATPATPTAVPMKKTSSIPATGDSLPLGGVVILLAVSLAGLCALCIIKRKAGR